VGAVVVVVLVGAVWLVTLVVAEAVVAAVVVVAVPAAAVVAVEVAEPADELPQAASSTTSGSRTRRFMSTVSLGTRWDACHYPDRHGP
jgi:hypothetical protein